MLTYYTNANVSIPLLDTWREKRSRERSAVGVGILPREGGGRRRWGVRIPQTMSRFLIPVLLYLHRLRPRGRPKQLKFDFCPYTERLILRRGNADGTRTTYPWHKTTTREGAPWREGRGSTNRSEGAREFRARVTREGRRIEEGKEEKIHTDGTIEERKICPLSRVPWTSFPERRQWCKVSLHLLEFHFVILILRTRTLSIIRGMIT